MTAASFIAFLAVFLAIGIASARRAQGTRKDYYLASQSVSPALVGLSAVATNNSGYMFIGVIGYTYATGLPAIWLMLGWILGDFLASLFIHRKITMATSTTGTLSFAGLLSRWQGTNFAVFCRVASIISIMFLGAYSAAQLAAGGKALHVLFGWPQATGAIIGSVIVLVYCIAGGIRASIWTDAAQSAVMLAAMAASFRYRHSWAWRNRGNLGQDGGHSGLHQLVSAGSAAAGLQRHAAVRAGLDVRGLQRGRPAAHHGPLHGAR